jgi:hypothetical protein
MVESKVAVGGNDRLCDQVVWKEGTVLGGGDVRWLK